MWGKYSYSTTEIVRRYCLSLFAFHRKDINRDYVDSIVDIFRIYNQEYIYSIVDYIVREVFLAKLWMIFVNINLYCIHESVTKSIYTLL